MSIIKAIERAYRTMEERGWDTIYWAVDLHGVCLKSNYEQGGYTWHNFWAKKVMKLISDKPENHIILWSSVHDDEKRAIVDFFWREGIVVQGFNSNIYEKNTKVSCFDEKFYFSVLLDDKAGFDPDVDWKAIWEFYERA